MFDCILNCIGNYLKCGTIETVVKGNEEPNIVTVRRAVCILCDY